MTNVTDSTEYAQTLNKGFWGFEETQQFIHSGFDIHLYRKMDTLIQNATFYY